jgi:glutathione peroxidase-family protein
MGIMQDLFQRNRYYVENPYKNFFEIQARDLNKNLVSFSGYKNKVLLIYNFCPIADKNFIKAEFDKLNQLKAKHINFEILAFPSCPGQQLSDEEMKKHILANEDINGSKNIKIFNRIYLNSSEMADAYKFCLRNSTLFDLKKGTAETAPDFTKFLIRKNGKVFEYYTYDMPLIEIDDNIHNLLNEKNSNFEVRTDYIKYNKYY